LQHVECEPAAAYAEELLDRGLEYVAVDVDEGGPLPDWREFSGIIAMGGPMSTYEDAEFPWLAAEHELIADAVRSGLPFWGVCLGAQLLASALGAPVRRTERPEIGVLPVELSRDAGIDPVFRIAPREFLAFHWHSDTYELPPAAVHLASSRATFQQAFTINRAYGLQFHLEVSAELAREWAQLPAYARSLDNALGQDALSPLLAAVQANAAEMTELARKLLGRWLETIVFPLHSEARTAEAQRAK
jgi:GMP synthase-like glutamine amidotransferase